MTNDACNLDLATKNQGVGCPLTFNDGRREKFRVSLRVFKHLAKSAVPIHVHF